MSSFWIFYCWILQSWHLEVIKINPKPSDGNIFLSYWGRSVFWAFFSNFNWKLLMQGLLFIIVFLSIVLKYFRGCILPHWLKGQTHRSNHRLKLTFRKCSSGSAALGWSIHTCPIHPKSLHTFLPAPWVIRLSLRGLNGSLTPIQLI